MKLVLFIGDHLRHLFLANKINDAFKIDGLIIEKRESQLPDFSDIQNAEDKELAEKHFNNRLSCEKLYFKDQNLDNFHNIEFVDNIDDNRNTCMKFIEKIKPDAVLLFGVSIIKSDLLSKLPKIKINLHSGLIPYFKGSAGNFWPFYFLKPNWCGYTFHNVEEDVDCGSIIHQSLPELKKNDSIHDVSCRGLVVAANDGVKILNLLEKNHELPSKNINNQGKFFSFSDFKYYHLRMIYRYFNDDIVNHYLNNQLKQKPPKTVKLF